jgi:hypothetical protein
MPPGMSGSVPVMPGRDTGLDQLRRIASAAVQELGHVMGGWVAPAGEEATARSAVCRRCGRTVNVRAEPGLTGVAGLALTERCTGPSVPSTG